MAANQDIFDAFIKHETRLQRLTNSQAAAILASLDGTNEALMAALFTAIDKIKETSVLSKGRTALYDSLTNKIKGIRTKELTASFASYLSELEQLITFENEYITSVHEKSIPVVIPLKNPSKKLLAAILTDGQFAGSSISDYFTRFAANDIDRIVSGVKSGVANGLPTEGIVRSIIGTKTTGYVDGAMAKSRRSVRTLVRTITSGVTNQTRNIWTLVNKDIIAYEVYTAVLDGRTTFVCASLDGNQYQIGEGPHPPLHFNCRSLRLPVIDLLAKEGLLGDRPYVRDTRTAKKQRKDFRKEAKDGVGAERWRTASLDQRRDWINKVKADWQDKAIGKTNGYADFGSWFSEQPAGFQREYLGPTRYGLYKNGTSFSDFVRPNGTNWTIKQLMERDLT